MARITYIPQGRDLPVIAIQTCLDDGGFAAHLIHDRGADRRPCSDRHGLRPSHMGEAQLLKQRHHAKLSPRAASAPWASRCRRLGGRFAARPRNLVDRRRRRLSMRPRSSRRVRRRTQGHVSIINMSNRWCAVADSSNGGRSSRRQSRAGFRELAKRTIEGPPARTQADPDAIAKRGRQGELRDRLPLRNRRQRVPDGARRRGPRKMIRRPPHYHIPIYEREDE